MFVGRLDNGFLPASVLLPTTGEVMQLSEQMFLSKVELCHAGGSRERASVCAMEAVAWLRGEAHRAAASNVGGRLAQLVVQTNDCLPNVERQALKPYVLLLAKAPASLLSDDRTLAAFGINEGPLTLQRTIETLRLVLNPDFDPRHNGRQAREYRLRTFDPFAAVGYDE